MLDIKLLAVFRNGIMSITCMNNFYSEVNENPLKLQVLADDSHNYTKIAIK